MNRICQSLSMFTVLGALGSLALVGCVDNGADGPMRILGNVAPGTGCSVDSSSNVFNDDGIVDTVGGTGYIFTPSVVNEITLLENEATGPKTIYVEGAHVEITFYDPDRFPASNFDADLLKFTVPSSGAIDPGGGTSAFSFEIVPAELVAAMQPTLAVDGTSDRTTLDVRIQMVGTKGGGSVESQWFRYPVQVCDDCLRVDRGSCEGLPDGFVPSTGGACNILQDDSLDCCDNFTVCPAAKPPGA